ncbi:long-chain fatty acid--CoA ligase [Bacillus sp. V2I10]|uniref:long-chain-fatty-acid--CoA ligase n=1 Tax=Bacillus sp. V2I10 TaxID=3042276 RepID=UPI00277DBEA3|nr:long-chain fatty acid--CoA ligase [Bacillus sp. V2I10]MDQ0860726.1 long-chain acyl-CoA synthetase [Bacillus sp. V2I10]
MERAIQRPWHSFYQHGEVHIPEQSVYTMLEKTAERYGGQTAIIFEEEELSYLELKSKVDLLAGKWNEMGFKKGERIGLMLANHPDYVISYYAAHALGLIVVQINPMYTARELLQIVTDAEVTSIVADASGMKTINEVSDLYSFRHMMASQLPDSDGRYLKLEELIAFGIPLKSPAEINAKEDVAVIQYTGGTTGKMKGAMLTHFNLTANVYQSCLMYGDSMVQGKETVLIATPLYHVYAMTSGMNLGIFIGGRLLLFRKFEIDDVLAKIKKHRPTFFPGVPKMYIAFVNHPEIEEAKLSCLKLCSSGSAPLPVEIIQRFERLTGTRIGEGFGLSEASPSTHRNPPFGKRKIGSIGIPVPETDCMIVDEDNRELGPKSVGELLIKGPQIMKGYWNNEAETHAALQNGWLYTGDLATMDDEGYFYIVGRKKEMIILGGFNIYPQEIEGVLYEHPDVKEAAVVGLPDEELGERVKAYVVPKVGKTIDKEELRGYCYTKLTPYKVPKQFEVRDSLPRNTVGKLLKRLLIKEESERGDNLNGN